MPTEENRKSNIMILLLFAILIPCSLFATLNLEPGFHKDNTIISDSIPRTFDYYIPANLPSEVSLVLLLHGHGGDADFMTGESGNAAQFKIWMDIADTAKIICLYPEGEFSPIDTNKRGWNDCRATAHSNPNVDDVKFLTALVDTFTSYFSVSPRSTFVSGMSNGGWMTMRLATEVPEMFGGFAAVCASMPQTSECSEPSIPASILLMNGTADSIMPFLGGYMNRDPSSGRGDVLSTWDAVNRWLSLNQITSTGRVDNMPDISNDDSTRVVKHSWESESNLKKVVLYEVIGGGHAEPSKKEKYADWWQDGSVFFDGVGNQNHDIEMAEEIWKFFSSLESTSVNVSRQIPVPYQKGLSKNGHKKYDLQGRQISKSFKHTNTGIFIVEDRKTIKKVIIGKF